MGLDCQSSSKLCSNRQPIAIRVEPPRLHLEFDVAWSIGEPRFATAGIILLTGGSRVVR
jgi:hypothetical protein